MKIKHTQLNKSYPPFMRFYENLKSKINFFLITPLYTSKTHFQKSFFHGIGVEISLKKTCL